MRRLNIRLLVYISGLILLIESLFMLACTPVSLIYSEDDFWAIMLAALITGFSGLILFMATRKTVIRKYLPFQCGGFQDQL